jgi:N-acetylglucosaminyldiphosphoundecaprenol N-acetyl-beta-D-mannosaminyltransferase
LSPSIDVLGLPLSRLDADGLIGLLAGRAAAKLRTTCAYANAHTVNLAMRDGDFARTLRAAEVLYADGASVAWASRFARARLPGRMTAADFFPRFARLCADRGLSVFLLGGREGIARQAARRLRRDVPHLRIAGTHEGHFDLSRSDEIVDAVNAASPDVLVVGMSSPRQESWLAAHGEALNVPVRWCVGALLDYLAGVERRGPRWLCRIGGEWLFRLLVDPRGKWRRYLVGHPRFVVCALRWRLRRRRDESGFGAAATVAAAAAGL